MYNDYNNKFIYIEFLASKLVGFIAAPFLSLQLEMMSIFAPSLMITCTVNAFYSIFFCLLLCLNFTVLTSFILLIRKYTVQQLFVFLGISKCKYKQNVERFSKASNKKKKKNEQVQLQLIS